MSPDGARRVVMVCPYSLTRPGGVQGQARGLAQALRRRGHTVALLAPDDAHRPGLVGDDGAGGHYALGHAIGLRSNGSVAPLALTPAAATRTTHWARRLGADLVHLHEPMAPVVGYGCLLRHPAPLVGTYHRAGDSRWYGLLRPIAGWANGRLDAAVAVSAAAAETARRAMGAECEVLFNGIEVDRFARAEPWPAEGPTVLFLGRHEERKGLGILLDAFCGSAGDPGVAPPARLWVAGAGPDTERLRRVVRDATAQTRVEWLGVVSDDEVARRLRAADILCAPSLRGESFGMVLLEAFAAGCAVVASDLDGYRAAAGGHAHLVPPGDTAALRDALVATLDEAGTATGRCSPEAKEAALHHARAWSMDRLAERYETVYTAVLEGRPTGPDEVA